MQKQERLYRETVTLEGEPSKRRKKALAEPQDAKDDLAEPRYNHLKSLLSKTIMKTTYIPEAKNGQQEKTSGTRHSHPS